MLQLSSRYDDDRTARANLQDPAIIMLELETMYISCESVDAAASLEDFVGVCVFTKDGSKVYTDANGRRVRSGYLWMVPSRDLRGSGTFHSQAYEKGFSNMDGRDGVAVVGFSQQNGRLQARSGTLNSGSNVTNMIYTSYGANRTMLFMYQAPIFGAVILHKVLASRQRSCQNLSVYACVLTVAICAVVQRHGTQAAKARLPNVQIDNVDFFQGMYPGFTNVSCKSDDVDEMVDILLYQILEMASSMNVTQFEHIKSVLEKLA
ncbi:hypothetical protein AAVH_23634, partial [Aphelenchoides avenae]